MKETSFKVVCFAGLRKFFGDELTLTNPLPISYKDIIEQLKTMKPAAKEILAHCRIAVNQEFVSLDSFKADNDTIYIVPPSSGG